MKTYRVYLTTHGSAFVEVDTENREDALDEAIDIAYSNLEPDWEIDYVEEID